MKILNVSPWFMPASAFGGPVIRLYHVSKNLAAMGHDVTVYTTDMIEFGKRNPSLPRYEEMNGIHVYRFPTLFRLRQWYYTPLMKESLKTIDCDVVNLFGLRGYQTTVASIILNRRGIPFAVSPVGSTPLAVEKSIGSIGLKLLYDLLSGCPAKLANIFITSCNMETQQLIKIGISPTHIRRIPSGVDLEEFNNWNSDRIRDKYNLNDKKVITWVGRVNVIKGLDFLLSAYKKVISVLSDVHLLLLGKDSGYGYKLKSLIREYDIENYVTWVEHPTRQDIVDAFHYGIVFPLVSRYEASPLVLFEAGASGCAVIATNVGGLPELIQDNYNGLIVSFGDKENLTTALLSILTNDKLRNRLVRNMRYMVETKHSYVALAKQTELVFKEMIR